ncbi:Penicillin-binding protein 2 [Burkholderiales bacterium]|nr:Penicillin-binding protein 2 [Burkholderiales bacterium]
MAPELAPESEQSAQLQATRIRVNARASRGAGVNDGPMNPLRNPEREVLHFRDRLVSASILVAVGFLVLLLRFGWLQVIRHADFLARAEQNRIALVPVTANRGLIKDRNGVIIAKNYSAYTLEIQPAKVEDLDRTIDALSAVVDIHPGDRRRFHKMLDDYKHLDSVPIRTRLSDEDVARFTSQRYRFPGVELRARLFRQYPMGEIASHLLGYIGRVSAKDEDRIDSFADPNNYNGTDYIGKIGVESSYEEQLHGTTGYEQVEITAGGHPVRTLARTASVPGNNLVLSIDIKLQEIVERAFGDRRGALIAIEPSTGDVLAFVSKPTYDPNLFVEGIDPVNWDALNGSIDKPLLNRALRGTYPIGSTYKPFLALAALELGKRRPESTMFDPGYYSYGGHLFREGGPKGGHGVVDLHKSIVVSSDVYYYSVANDLGVDAIHDFMRPFGFGELTGIDIEGELAGILPSSEWNERRFHQKWFGGETISIGIGQGKNAFTLLQLAHATATLANNGVVMKPHVVKAIEDARTGKRELTVTTESARIPLRPENIAFVRAAMVGVTSDPSGTAYAAFVHAPYSTAGKTGTAQVVGIGQNEKYDERRVEERHRDHSLFIAFAPAEPGVQPTIALALLVENGGWGALAAAPIARQVMDYYLLSKEPPLPAAGVVAQAQAPAAAPVDRSAAAARPGMDLN